MTVRNLSDFLRIAVWRWQLRRMASELGVPGTIGAGLIAFAIMYALSALPPLDEELDALRQAAEQPISADRTAESRHDATLMALPQTFPARSDLLVWLDRLHEAAESDQLRIDLCEYKLVAETTSFQTYELTFPVRADYAKLRGFLSQALADNPSLSLDQISFRRQKISDSELSADIRMTQYLKAD